MLTLGVQAGYEGEGVVGEESFVVQGISNQLSCSGHTHWLLVIVLVVHISALDDLLKGGCIGLKSGCSYHDLRRSARHWQS